MKQIEQVKEWMPQFNSSTYALNESGSKYYGYTFYKRNAWDGMFLNDLEYLKNEYKHVINLETGEEV